MNAVAALSFGWLMQGAASRRLIAPVWLVGALCGSLFSWAATNTTSVGASGGIMGMSGFLLVMAHRRRATLPPDFFHSFVRSTMWVGVLGILAWEVIDNAAHLGGLLGGAAVGAFVFRNSEGVLPVPDTWLNAIVGRAGEIVFVVIAFYTMARLF
jgi:membrane associated rhomboid family serine protease